MCVRAYTHVNALTRNTHVCVEYVRVRVCTTTSQNGLRAQLKNGVCVVITFPSLCVYLLLTVCVYGIGLTNPPFL